MNGKVEIIDRLTSIVLPDPCPLLKPYAKYIIGNIHYMDLKLIIFYHNSMITNCVLFLPIT